MPVISAPHAFNESQLYVDLEPLFGRPLLLKCEGFNFAGSIKLKAATEMVETAERDGDLTPESILVESSSGNLGVALSMIAASKGYRFLCVTDSRCNLSTRLLMEALGSRVHTIASLDAKSSFLSARLDYVRALCDSDDRYVWLSQYTNPGNWKAHYRKTAPEIAQRFPHLDVLFVGAGTTGTLMGCARYFRQWHRPVRIVAVDSVGSVTFGGAPGRRMIPGLGMSVPPPLLDESYVDEVIRVEETDTIRACHRLAKRGFLFGGSTGTVVSGAMRWLDDHDTRDLTAVAIAPDLGERYLDTIYQSNWLHDLYGEDMLDAEETAAGPWAADPVPTLQGSRPPHPPAKRRRRR
ncbi:2,3-diaminopropionate biosynthesis protein SbnA [Streptomyces sp. NWU339]|uniref:2,3-diaminopropionate biosynthesis protein SbnA n=1 Tax=Streptomyces sp. NWU339 TaxID=2185284 RepID=UPI000D677E03|nr:2,3-diaminopropionate biosynthesis protein SbnA [Streptomyces sp. NWU339]PWI05223.1 2,3-diaminopropionate biosynthesis protein SbnA [Streptomyces sp. NWU339]